jgi:hypothetical protein
MRRTFIAILAALTMGVLQMSAQPSAERGFRADGVYQITPYDTVDLFSGNVHVTVPIGQKYRVSDSLSYEITLRYAGKLWWFFEYCAVWPGNDGSQCRDRLGTINSNSNAGFGWWIGFGRLRSHMTYETREVGFAYESPDMASTFFKVLRR